MPSNIMDDTPYNARYKKLIRFQDGGEFYILYHILVKRWICRLTTVCDSCVISYVCWTCEKIIKKSRVNLSRFLYTNMHKSRGSNHAIFVLCHEKIVPEIWSNRGNENVFSMNFSLCPRRKRFNKVLDFIDPSFGYGCGVDVIDKRALLNWRRWRWINFRKDFNFHWMLP